MFEIKQGDTKPDLVFHLGYGTYGTGSWVPQNVTGATVVLYMILPGQTPVVKINGKACTMDAAATGDGRYLWATDGTDTNADGSTTAVIYDVEIFVTYADGSTQTFPTGTDPQVKVNPKRV